MKRYRLNYFFLILLFFVIILIYVFEQVESRIMLRRLNKLNIEKNKQIEEFSKLQMEYTELIFPKRLEEIAKEYNFIIPSKEKFVYIEEYENNK